MKNIIVIMIMMMFCAESFASGCATGYACSLADLNKKQNIQQRKDSKKMTKNYKKRDIQRKNYNKKSQKSYRDLFIFDNWLY